MIDPNDTSFDLAPRDAKRARFILACEAACAAAERHRGDFRVILNAAKDRAERLGGMPEELIQDAAWAAVLRFPYPLARRVTA